MNFENKEEWLQKTAVVFIGALLCCGLWGSAFPCIKIGYSLFEIGAADTAAQILFAGVRFTIAGVLTVIIGSVAAQKSLIPKKESWHMIFKLSMIQTVAQYVFFYVGLANTTGVKASIIEAMNVFFAIIISSLLFRQEKITFLKTAGCAVGFTGVVLINMTKNGIDTAVTLNGEGFILLSTLAYAFSQVFIKKYSKYENPVILSGYQFFIGGIIMMTAGFAMGGRLSVITVQGAAMLVYLACISAVAYSVWGILLNHNPVSRVAIFGFMNPVFGVLLSALFVAEESTQAFGMKSLISLFLVCIGIYLTNKKEME